MNKNFVIISHQRTGSNMLRKALNHHSDIFCHSELLLDSKDMNQILKLMKERKKESFCFLLKYDQIDSSILNFLKNNNFKIIHLKRRNKLKSFISRMVGTGNNRKYPVNINITQAKAVIQDIYQWEAITDSMFTENSLTVFYEKIIDENRVPAEVIKFFNLPYQTCELEDTKLNPDNLEVLVENYKDLLREFPEYI